VKLLSDHRHDLVVQRTRIASQIRWYLHELDPDLVIPSRGLRRHCVVARLRKELDRFDGVVARLARNLLTKCGELNHQINPLEAELRKLVRDLPPSLLAIPGCGVQSAAVIIGETAGPIGSVQGRLRPLHRHRTRAGMVRRQQRQGPTQPRRQPGDELCPAHNRGHSGPRRGPGQAYLDRQRGRGKDTTAALRLLRRQLSDAVFTALRADQHAASAPRQAALAA